MTGPVTDETKRALLLAAVRCARARVQLLQLELDEVGLALRFNMVAPDAAVAWLHDTGALPYVNGAITAMPQREAA
jgi:hypothetical protein